MFQATVFPARSRKVWAVSVNKPWGLVGPTVCVQIFSVSVDAASAVRSGPAGLKVGMPGGKIGSEKRAVKTTVSPRAAILGNKLVPNKTGGEKSRTSGKV